MYSRLWHTLRCVTQLCEALGPRAWSCRRPRPSPLAARPARSTCARGPCPRGARPAARAWPCRRACPPPLPSAAPASPGSVATVSDPPSEVCACGVHVGACALHEHERLHREALGMRCGVAASVVAAARVHAPSASCCVCACTVTVPVLDGPVCAARARSHRALRPTERRLQTVAAARRQGRRWRRTKVPWA